MYKHYVEHLYKLCTKIPDFSILEYPSAQLTITNIVKLNSIKKVLEVNFNEGFTSFLLLTESKDVSITSFDVGKTDYVLPMKNLIDISYPDRHALIMGDIDATIPEYAKNNPDSKYDLIIINGDSNTDTFNAMINCSYLATDKTIIVINNVYLRPLSKTPKPTHQSYAQTTAWQRAIKDKLVKEDLYIVHNTEICKASFVGKYLTINEYPPRMSEIDIFFSIFK